MPNAEKTSPNDTRTLKRVFAADLGGTHLRSAIVDQIGKIGFRLKQRTPPAQKPEEIVDALVAAVREGEQQNTTGEYTVDAVSVVVPGTVNVASGVIVKAPNLSCLNGFHLTEALSRVLKRPTILANDANAAAVGEMWQGAAYSAAEIGHMCVDPFSGVACGCGSRGCLEVYASATAIARMTREAKP